jgi:predicted RNA-binding protein YlxR (DUF448 family)
MGRDKTYIPIRTCISCGAKRSKNELIRLVLDAQGQVMRDDLFNRQGRGAYVCPRKPCWESLRSGRRLNRAFKKEGNITVNVYFEGNEHNFLK